MTRFPLRSLLQKNSTQLALITIYLIILSLDRLIISASYILLCIWALIGPKQSIKALSLNYIIVLLNPAIFSLPSEIGILRWVILMVVFLRMIPNITKKSFRFLIPLLIFFLLVTAQSWFTSPQFAISILKLTAFTVCAATALIAFDSLSQDSLNEIKNWFLIIAAAVLVLSIPTIFMPQVGYAVNGRGLQGLFNHPQAFGTFLSPIAGYVAARLVFLKKFDNKFTIALGVVAVNLMVFSRARTAAVALFMSLGAAMVTGLLSVHRKKIEFAATKTLIRIGVIVFLVAIFVIISPGFSETIERFWLKGDQKNVESAFYHSRGSGIVFYWQRFLQEPLIGHGFGVDVAHGNEKNPKTFLGIPISASTEKGFLPVAFLEEVGVLGLIFFTPFLAVLFRRVMRQTDIGLIAMFFSCLFVNIGEAIFFSPGQLGGYFWLLIGLSTAKRFEEIPFPQKDRLTKEKLQTLTT